MPNFSSLAGLEVARLIRLIKKVNYVRGAIQKKISQIVEKVHNFIGPPPLG